MKPIKTMALVAALVALAAACSTDKSPAGPVAWRALSADAEDQPLYSDWSPPINLGPIINSGSNEQHPAISKDGLSLYFASDRAGAGGMGGMY